MKFLLPLVLLMSTVGIARAESLPESLMHCDSRFFSELFSQRATFKHVAPLTTDKAQHAWYAPKDGSEATWFAHPVKTGQVTISGYWQQKSDLEEMGKYYFWGLIIEESPDAVMKALSQANWQKNDDVFIANPMIKSSGTGDWQVNSGAASGIAPAKNSVEKLVLLDELNGKSRLLCSVQGSVTDADLLPLRPDLQGTTK
ncbi:hypothetical protein [Citrobacter tructae]|uniref:hypothetical protein n=1 Tax=Citrobacter tructae TaxID=2562449 RepID=UPI003F542ED1